MSEPLFPHLDQQGHPRMVDVGSKPVTRRTAIAEGRIFMTRDTVEVVAAGRGAKGDVLHVAQLAGIMGAKRTAELIPLCHPLALNAIEMQLEVDRELPGVHVRATVAADANTGVEMEALTAVSCALLTVYDMCKARDREMRIGEIRLLRKEGGRSGTWSAADQLPDEERVRESEGGKNAPVAPADSG